MTDRRYCILNFHFNNFMKQYFPNSNIIITTYPCIYLYIQHIYIYIYYPFLLYIELLVLAIHCSNLPKIFGFGTIGVGVFLVFEVIKLFYHHRYWYSKDSSLLKEFFFFFFVRKKGRGERLEWLPCLGVIIVALLTYRREFILPVYVRNSLIF